MNKTDLLVQTLQLIDADAPRRARLNTYYAGNSPLAFLAPEARLAIGGRLDRLTSNLCRVAVNAVVERLRVSGFDGDHGSTAWAEWKRLDLDQLAPMAMREALITGEAFALTWADVAGRPTITIESADQLAVQRDLITGEVVVAAKRIQRPNDTLAVLYERNTITKFRSDSVGPTLNGWTVTETVPNPLGVVPCVPIRNQERLVGSPASDLDDLMPLQDAVAKLLADMMVASEYAGRPRRWATGVELEEEAVLDELGNPTGETRAVNPYPEGSRMMVAEAAEAKFGQLPAADLAGYEAGIRVLQAQISAVSGLAPHYLGVHGDQPASADALRASEAALVSKVEQRAAMFGRAWEAVARLLVAVSTSADPHAINLAIKWADPATRSVAQEADAASKLVAAGVIDTTTARERLGIETTPTSGAIVA